MMLLKVRAAALSMGTLVLCLLIMLPGTGEVDEEVTLHNEINSSYLYWITSSFRIYKDDIDSQYGKPDLVRHERDYTYEIREMADGSKLVSFFDSQGGYLLDQWRLSRLPERSEFEALVLGETHALDIKRIDPYFKLMPNSDAHDITGTSEHRLRDSGLATIQYKHAGGRWIVDSIQYMEQDPSGFVSKLRAEDRAAFGHW